MKAASKRRRATQHGPATRLRQMHDRLAAAYGPQSWWPAETPLEVVLGAYLTQNTAWKSVERSLANLKAHGVSSIESLCKIPVNQLAELIRPSGFATRKAPALKAFATMLHHEFSSSLDSLAALPTEVIRKRLIMLPGVGPETADAILLYALGHPVPVADEYLRRIAERHELADRPLQRNQKGYETLVQLSREAFAGVPPAEQAQVFNEFHALVVAVGKTHCRKVAQCEGCPLAYDLTHPYGATGTGN